MHVHVWRFPLWHLKCYLTFSTKHLWCKTSVCFNYNSARFAANMGTLYFDGKIQGPCHRFACGTDDSRCSFAIKAPANYSYHDPVKTG